MTVNKVNQPVSMNFPKRNAMPSTFLGKGTDFFFFILFSLRRTSSGIFDFLADTLSDYKQKTETAIVTTAIKTTK